MEKFFKSLEQRLEAFEGANLMNRLKNFESFKSFNLSGGHLCM